jgi:hypothetical protein
MTALALSLLLKFWPVLAGIAGALWWGIRQRRAGRAEGEAKLAKARQKAAEELHEMDREATEAERKAAAMSDGEARKEALKWRKSSL